MTEENTANEERKQPRFLARPSVWLLALALIMAAAAFGPFAIFVILNMIYGNSLSANFTPTEATTASIVLIAASLVIVKEQLYSLT